MLDLYYFLNGKMKIFFSVSQINQKRLWKKLRLANYSSLLGKMLAIQLPSVSSMKAIKYVQELRRSSQTGDRKRYTRKVLNLQKVSLGYDKIFFRHQTFVFLPQILFVSLTFLWISIHCINIYYVFIHKNFKALKLPLNTAK